MSPRTTTDAPATGYRNSSNIGKKKAQKSRRKVGNMPFAGDADVEDETKLVHDFLGKPSRNAFQSHQKKDKEVPTQPPSMQQKDSGAYFPCAATQAKAIATALPLASQDTDPGLVFQKRYRAWQKLFLYAGLDKAAASTLADHMSSLFSSCEKGCSVPWCAQALHNAARNMSTPELPAATAFLNLGNALKDFDLDAVDTVIVLKMVLQGPCSTIDVISFSKVARLAKNTELKKKLPVLHHHFKAIDAAYSDFKASLSGSKLSDNEMEALFRAEHGSKRFDVNAFDLKRAVDLLVEDEVIAKKLPGLNMILKSKVREALMQQKRVQPHLAESIDEFIRTYIDSQAMEVDAFDRQETQLQVKLHLRQAHRIEKEFFRSVDDSAKAKLAEQMKQHLDVLKSLEAQLEANGCTYGLLWAWLGKIGRDGMPRTSSWWDRFYLDVVSPVDGCMHIEYGATDSESEVEKTRRPGTIKANRRQVMTINQLVNPSLDTATATPQPEAMRSSTDMGTFNGPTSKRADTGFTGQSQLTGPAVSPRNLAAVSSDPSAPSLLKNVKSTSPVKVGSKRRNEELDDDATSSNTATTPTTANSGAMHVEMQQDSGDPHTTSKKRSRSASETAGAGHNVQQVTGSAEYGSNSKVGAVKTAHTLKSVARRAASSHTSVYNAQPKSTAVSNGSAQGDETASSTAAHAARAVRFKHNAAATASSSVSKAITNSTRLGSGLGEPRGDDMSFLLQHTRRFASQNGDPAMSTAVDKTSFMHASGAGGTVASEQFLGAHGQSSASNMDIVQSEDNAHSEPTIGVASPSQVSAGPSLAPQASSPPATAMALQGQQLSTLPKRERTKRIGTMMSEASALEEEWKASRTSVAGTAKEEPQPLGPLLSNLFSKIMEMAQLVGSGQDRITTLDTWLKKGAVSDDTFRDEYWGVMLEEHGYKMQ